jgi:hypothetical protein
MEMYQRKPGSLANNNVNCIDFYWYKFNKLWKRYEMLKNILYFLCLTFFSIRFSAAAGYLFLLNQQLRKNMQKRYLVE